MNDILSNLIDFREFPIITSQLIARAPQTYVLYIAFFDKTADKKQIVPKLSGLAGWEIKTKKGSIKDVLPVANYFLKHRQNLSPDNNVAGYIGFHEAYILIKSDPLTPIPHLKDIGSIMIFFVDEGLDAANGKPTPLTPFWTITLSQFISLWTSGTSYDFNCLCAVYQNLSVETKVQEKSGNLQFEIQTTNSAAKKK